MKFSVFISQFPKEKGFTLVELLAVVAILSVVGTLLFGVISTTLRGSNKAESLTLLQQSGNSVLSQVTRTVRFAKSIEVPTACYTEDSTSVTVQAITIRTIEDATTTFSCNNLPDGTINRDGTSLLDTSAVKVTECEFTCSQQNPYDKPTVTFSFVLAQNQANALIENNSTLQFQSTITLRNSEQ